MASAVAKIEATYQVPFLAHAAMEPMNCTVHVHKDGCEVWVGTQVLARAQEAAAKAAALPLDKVVVHNHLIGGGFGRRLEIDGVIRAVQIAQQVDGPVKVVWTREEDIQHDMYRPYFFDRMSAGLDEKGMPVVWSHRFAGSSVIARWLPPSQPWRQARSCTNIQPGPPDGGRPLGNRLLQFFMNSCPIDARVTQAPVSTPNERTYLIHEPSFVNRQYIYRGSYWRP
jgi:hypothetical protein